jgi:hypothetical protein
MQLLTRTRRRPYVLGVAGGARSALWERFFPAGTAGGSFSEWRIAGGAAAGAFLAAVLLFALLGRRLAGLDLERTRGQLDRIVAGRGDDRLGLLGDRLPILSPGRPGPVARHGVLLLAT